MAVRELRLCVGKQYPGTKLRWTAATPEIIESGEWLAAFVSLRSSLAQADAALDTVSEIAPDFLRLKQRAEQLIERVTKFSEPCGPAYVRWVDVGAQLRLVESPLNIADAVKTRLLGAAGESSKSWIFTSATLGDDEKLSWFTKPCGLENARVLRIGSPFDYPTQSAMYVPPNIPKPSEPAHASRVGELVAEWAGRIGGRTMVLTTTLKALRTIGDVLHRSLGEAGQIDVLVQGDRPKRALIERFRRGDAEEGRGCVLVASASFWEGIDVPGDALQLLVIDKLPFPPPNDPMAEARSKAIEAEGRNPFNDYFLPEAAVSLKQGAGRLIRRETDQGMLVVCDTRLTSMGYGKRLIRALPSMKRLATEEEFLERLDCLTRTYTKGYQRL